MSRPTKAAAEVRSIIERVLDLKKQQDELGADIRDIYLEARQRGWNKTSLGQAVSVIRRREKDGVAFDDAANDTAQYLQAYYGTGTLLAPHAHEAELPAHDPETGEIAAPVKAAAEHREPPALQASPSHEEDEAGRKSGLPDGFRHEPEISPEHGMEPRGIQPIVAVGRHDRRNTGGGHEVAGENVKLEKGAAGEGLNAVPADPAAARIDAWQMQEDIPAALDRRTPAIAVT